MTSDNRLGEFLRARRELTRPEERGLPAQSRRRVPGLRREEVAVLAGISPEYYVRLERGRDRHPSAQVIEALAGVLDLDADSTAYLSGLASELPRAPRARREPPSSDDGIAIGVSRMLDGLAGVPAFVINRRLDVLAYNALAEALHGGPPAAGGGGNVVRQIFLDPAARRLYPDWSDVAAEAVATLRAATGADRHDRRLAQLVGELSLKSPEFARLWARHDVRTKSSGTKRFRSPALGDITLDWETLSVASAPGQLIVAYFAEPASVAHARLVGQSGSTRTSAAGSADHHRA